MMDDTTLANARMMTEWAQAPRTILGWAILFGWTVGFLIGMGAGAVVCEYFVR